MTGRDELRARLREMGSSLASLPDDNWSTSELEQIGKDAVAELEASERDREALAEARRLIVNHVIATGGCASVDGMGLCDRPLCSYCALARLRLDDKEPTDD